MRIAVMVTLAATLCASALAQTRNTTMAEDVSRIKVAVAANPPVLACSPTARDASGFTECEALKLSYLISVETPYELKLQTMDEDRMKFIDSLTPNYPGKTYEPPSKNYPIGRLVDAVAAPVAPVAPKAPVNIGSPTPAVKK